MRFCFVGILVAIGLSVYAKQVAARDSFNAISNKDNEANKEEKYHCYVMSYNPKTKATESTHILSAAPGDDYIPHPPGPGDTDQRYMRYSVKGKTFNLTLDGKGHNRIVSDFSVCTDCPVEFDYAGSFSRVYCAWGTRTQVAKSVFSKFSTRVDALLKDGLDRLAPNPDDTDTHGSNPGAPLPSTR